MISNIIDVKLGIDIHDIDYRRSFSKYDTMFFNDSSRWMIDNETNLIFTGDTLAAMYYGSYYNFRLVERAMESEDSYIKGKINRK